MDFNLNTLLLAIHLLGASAWFGAGWYDRLMVSPVVKSAGAAGATYVRTFLAKGGGGKWFAPAGFLTILTGIALYWRLGITMSTTSGLLLTVGAAFGIAAMLLGIFFHRPSENRLKALAAGDDDAALMDAAIHHEKHITFSAWLVTVAFLLMALRTMA